MSVDSLLNAGIITPATAVQFRKQDAERINRAVLAYEGGRRQERPSKLPRSGGDGGGEGLMLLGKVNATWNKGSLSNVTVHSEGDPLQETPANPAQVIQNVVNKLTRVPSGSWVFISQIGETWYLISAEC
jgi:hypothetical protein